MSIFLDTNACIMAINQHAVFRERLMRHAEPVATSSVVVFELRYGIAKSQQIARNNERTNLFLETIRILDFDLDDARMAAEIRASLERTGTPIGPYDLLIAGQAVRHNFLLVTANVREFTRVKGLRWEDWSKPARR